MSKLEDDARPTRTRRRLGRAAVVGAVAVATVVGGGGTAWAWWTASAAVTASVSTDANKVPAPTGSIGCSSYLTAVNLSFTGPTQTPPIGATQDFEITVTGSSGGKEVLYRPRSPVTVDFTDIPGLVLGSISMTVRTRYTFADKTTLVSDQFIGPRSARKTLVLVSCS